MSSLNSVTLIGRLGSDVIADPNNHGSIKIAKGSLATSESYQDKSKEWKEVTEWHQIRFFDKLAEGALKKLKKGMQVCCIGKLKTWKYEKDGKTMYATAVKVEKFFTLGASAAKASEPAMEAEMVMDESDAVF